MDKRFLLLVVILFSVGNAHSMALFTKQNQTVAERLEYMRSLAKKSNAAIDAKLKGFYADLNKFAINDPRIKEGGVEAIKSAIDKFLKVMGREIKIDFDNKTFTETGPDGNERKFSLFENLDTLKNISEKNQPTNLALATVLMANKVKNELHKDAGSAEFAILLANIEANHLKSIEKNLVYYINQIMTATSKIAPMTRPVNYLSTIEKSIKNAFETEKKRASEYKKITGTLVGLLNQWRGELKSSDKRFDEKLVATQDPMRFKEKISLEGDPSVLKDNLIKNWKFIHTLIKYKHLKMLHDYLDNNAAAIKTYITTQKINSILNTYKANANKVRFYGAVQKLLGAKKPIFDSLVAKYDSSLGKLAVAYGSATEEKKPEAKAKFDAQFNKANSEFESICDKTNAVYEREYASLSRQIKQDIKIGEAKLKKLGVTNVPTVNKEEEPVVTPVLPEPEQQQQIEEKPETVRTEEFANAPKAPIMKEKSGTQKESTSIDRVKKSIETSKANVLEEIKRGGEKGFKFKRHVTPDIKQGDKLGRVVPKKATGIAGILQEQKAKGLIKTQDVESSPEDETTWKSEETEQKELLKKKMELRNKASRGK